MSEERLNAIEDVLEQIRQRNAKVEADKAWERSATRIALICAITYLVAAALLFTLGAQRFWLDALVPTVGFLLSSQSLPAAKKWWTRSFLAKEKTDVN